MTRRRTALAAVALALALAIAWWALRPRAEQLEAPAPIAAPIAAPAPAPAPAQVETVRPPIQLPRAQLTNAAAPRRCELGGRVVSLTTQAGIAGAELSFEHLGTVSTTRTGPDGSFELLTPMEGEWTLAAILAPGFHPYAPQWGHSPFEVHLQQGVRVGGLRFVLTPQVDYAGVVVGPDDAPISGAEITILGGERALVGASAKKVSGADGTFVFQAEDRAVLVARHPRYFSARASLDFGASVTRTLTLRMRPLPTDAGLPAQARLAGQVLDSQRVPVPSALVSVRWAKGGGDQADEETLTDADGRFAFEVDEGKWEVTARSEGLVPGSARVQVPGAAVELILARGGWIRGRVEDRSGQPVSAFTVVVSTRKGPIQRTDEVARSVVDARGAFAVGGLAGGSYAVSAQAAGFAPADEVNVELAAGGEANARVVLGRGGKVAGKVVSRKSGQPLAGARVALENASSAGQVQISGETRTAADGSFELDGVPPRRVSVFVAASDHHARILSALHVREGEVTQVGTVDLGPVEKGDTPRIELVGIGAVLKAEGDGLTLLKVFPEGGAAAVGLKSGDVLLQIDGESAATLGFGGGIEKIRGPESSTVHLSVRRVDGTVVELDAPRRRIASK